MEPCDLVSQPSVIQEYEKCVRREAQAFAEWKVRLKEKVANSKLPVSVGNQIESFTILDMFDDMRAHSLRMATSVRVAAFQVEFSKIPNASRKGVLRWYNRIAQQDGSPIYNDLNEILSEIAIRAEPRDEYLLGASLRLRDYCDQIYERLVGRIYRYAIRPKYLRPWHTKKNKEILDAELEHNLPRNKFYMSDEELKRLVLMVANSDRITHNITSVPAIFDEFRNTFQLKQGQMMLRDNDDFCAAANAARVEFACAYNHCHPLWDTLDASEVVTEDNADVLGTDVSGASGHTTTDHLGLFSDLNDESLRLLKQLKLDMRRTEASGLSVVGTPAPAGSVSVGSSHGDLTQPRSYDSRAQSSHGDDADAAAAGGLSTRAMFDWDALELSEDSSSRADVPGDFAMRFPGGAAGPAPPPSEAGVQPEAKAKLWTWLSNNLPPAPPHTLTHTKGKGKNRGKRSYMIDSGSPAMNTPMAPVPKPSTAASAWQSSRTVGSWSSNWSTSDTHGVPPWNAESDHGWQGSGRGWQVTSWRDDAWQDDAAGRPAAKRGSAPYGEPKGKKGKKGFDQDKGS
jgi:hypothetical protein